MEALPATVCTAPLPEQKTAPTNQEMSRNEPSTFKTVGQLPSSFYLSCQISHLMSRERRGAPTLGLSSCGLLEQVLISTPNSKPFFRRKRNWNCKQLLYGQEKDSFNLSSAAGRIAFQCSPFCTKEVVEREECTEQSRDQAKNTILPRQGIRLGFLFKFLLSDLSHFHET